MENFHAIIPSFNPGEMISSCILSIRENIPDSRITVVDNNSEDGTPEFLKKNFPEVEIIRNSTNLGFGSACNMGSRGSDCEYLIFINQDAQINRFPIEEVVQVFSENEYSIIGGKVLSHESLPSPSVGARVSPLSTLMHWATMPLRLIGLRWFDMIAIPESEEFSQVQWIPGSLMVFRASDFVTLGGFDESFFMYVEDIEICYRAESRGMKTGHLPSIISSHSSRGGEGISRIAVHHTLKNQKTFLSRRHGQFLSTTAITISTLFCIVYGLLGSMLLFPFGRFRRSSVNLLLGGLTSLATLPENELNLR